jgi:aspartyl protease/PDZ domain-containing protein
MMPGVGRPFSSLAVLIALAIIAFSQQQQSASPSAEDVVIKWRHAVHAEKQEHSKLAVLASDSNQDGIQGRVEEWITTSPMYRGTVKREYDEGEVVLTGQFAKRRDWNGFVRDVQGKELARLRTEVFEQSVIVFGPPTQMPGATLSQSDEKKMYLLRTTPPGAAPMTWYVDATTWLPVKSVRPGDDSEITTTYDDWAEANGINTPHRFNVSETDKPDYQCRQTALHFEKGIAPNIFEAPKPGPSDASLQPGAPAIPFTLESNHIVFNVRLNGSDPIGFILDTGADENVINTPRLAAFGLKTYGKTEATGGGGSAEYDYATGATFTLPGVKLRNQHVAVLDQTGLERALGVPLGGLLGYDFLSRFVVEIDYEKKLLTLHDPKTWSYSGAGYAVPVVFDDGIPFTDGSISVGPKTDIPAFFVIDFGAAETMTLTSPFVKANDLVNLAQTNAFVNRPAGLENQFFSQNNVRGHIDRLALGKLIERSIPINMSVNVKGAYASTNFSGTIGQSIFRRYHVFLDYARNRVIFEPTAESSAPFPERKTYGLTIIASGTDLHTYTITAVRPGSQAEKDGFKKGDVISDVNGKPAAQITLSQLREQLTSEGESYDVGVSRAQDKIIIPARIKLVSLDKG